MMTAGHRRRARNVAIALIVFAGFMHLLAYAMVGRYAHAGIVPDKATLVVVTGTMLLSWSLLLSQAMESVTRAFYTRSDLDLILTSPVSPRKIFSVRIGRIAVAVAVVAMLLAAPFINVLAFFGGSALARRLRRGRRHGRGGGGARGSADSGVVPHHRRQAHAADRADRGGGDRRGFRHRPADRGDPVLWQPVALRAAAFGMADRARARGRQRALVAGARGARRSGRADAGAAISIALLGAAILVFSAASATTWSPLPASRKPRAPAPLVASLPPPLAGPRAAAERMDAARRDPWLMSQTLMQILYLLPPALLLWRSFRSGTAPSSCWCRWW